MPQQIDPHSPGIEGPAAWQVSPVCAVLHDASAPHMHAPLTHASPAPQQVPPHAGPSLQCPVGAQLGIAGASRRASAIGPCLLAGHAVAASTSRSAVSQRMPS